MMGPPRRAHDVSPSQGLEKEGSFPQVLRFLLLAGRSVLPQPAEGPVAFASLHLTGLRVEAFFYVAVFLELWPYWEPSSIVT